MEGIRLNEAKHESYLQLWRGRVMECRNSGKPVAVWCEEQGINIKTYYYWQKQVWDKTANTIIPNGQSSSPQVRPVQFAQVNLVPDKTSTDADIVIRKDSWTVEIRNTANVATIIQNTFHMNPQSDALFLFCGRRCDRIKALY